MSEVESESKEGYLVIIAAMLLLCAVAWLVFILEGSALEWLGKYWIDYFGVKPIDDTPWRLIPIITLVALGPIFLLVWAAFIPASRYYNLNFASIHEVNIKGLGKAKLAIQQSLKSVEAIEREFQGKMDSYESLKKQIDDLQAVKDIDTRELKKKLNAIASANANALWVQRIMAFVMGIITSLLAAYIWEQLIAI